MQWQLDHRVESTEWTPSVRLRWLLQHFSTLFCLKFVSNKPNLILKQRICQFLSQLCGQSTDERLEPSNKRRIVGYNCVNNRNQLISSKLLASNTWDGRAGSSSSSSSGGAKQVVNNQQKCVECCVAHRSDESIVLYKLLCNHLICRKQLLTKLDPKLATIICKECKCLTRKQSIVKLNHM